MKAKIKECNMIVDVEHQNLGEKGSDISFWCESLDKSFSRYELDFDYNKSKATTEIDWEQRRFEIAREIMPQIYKQEEETSRAYYNANPRGYRERNGADVIAHRAIIYADELINQLKQQNDGK